MFEIISDMVQLNPEERPGIDEINYSCIALKVFFNKRFLQINMIIFLCYIINIISFDISYNNF